MDHKNFYISELLAKKMAGSLTEEESTILEQWRSESSINDRIYHKVCTREFKEEKEKQHSQFDNEEGWQGYLKKRRVSFRRKRSIRIFRYASLIMLPLFIALYFVNTDTQPINLPDNENVFETTLVLADGSQIYLDNYNEHVIHGVKGKIILEQGERHIRYVDTTPQVGTATTYNELFVPACRTFLLTLNDGTHVYLNSKSSIRYPVAFSGDLREVEIKGEVYFEVAHNPDKPFVVNTGHCRIEVLGTKFNISSYEEDPWVKTTLEEGSVRIKTDGETLPVILNPDEQHTYVKESGEIFIEEVDAKDFTAWKDYRIRFRDTPLGEVMKQISRWYGCEVEFEDPSLKELTFGVNIYRFESIDPVLKVFEQTGKVVIEKGSNNSIFIKSGK